MADLPLSEFMRSATGLDSEQSFVLQHVGFDKTIVRAEGCDLFDSDGAHYLDALAHYGALPFGHNPEPLWRRLLEMRDLREPAFAYPMRSTGAERLAAQLIELVPRMAHVSFVTGAAEAKAHAIELARARTGRTEICGDGSRRVDRAGDDVDPSRAVSALERSLRGGEVAALFVEPVQAEAGMLLQPDGYLIQAQRLCRKYGTLLVLDELQSGLGRTGELMGFMHHGAIEPDMVLLGDALGGGLMPLGAVLCTQQAWSDAACGARGSMLAASHLATTIGSATLELLLADSGALLRHVAGLGALLRAGLERIAQRYPEAIAGVHGQGLMQGLQLQPWSGATSYFNAHLSQRGYAAPTVAGYLLHRRKLLTAPTLQRPNVLRIQPPLTIDEAQLARVLRGLEVAAEVIAAQDFAELYSCMVPESARASVRRVPRPARARVRVERDAARRPRFGFVVHPLDEDGLCDMLPPDVRRADIRVRQAWRSWLHSWSSRLRAAAPVFHLERIDSPTGASAEGWLIGCTLTPAEMMRLDPAARDALLADHVRVARELEVDVLGLGGFSAALSRGGTSLLDCGIDLTTGSSLTALASVETALHHAERRFGKRPLRCAVIGGAGAVGRLAAIHLARRAASELWLIGNLPSLESDGELLAVASEIRAGASGEHACTVHTTTDIGLGLREAELVLTAVGFGSPFLQPERFAPDAIICDIARPLDVYRRAGLERGDLLILEGGLVTLPGALRFGEQNLLGYPSGVNLACLSETIALALDGARGHHSIGPRIEYTHALEVCQIARRHGFAPFTGLLPVLNSRRPPSGVQAPTQIRPVVNIEPRAAWQ